MRISLLTIDMSFLKSWRFRSHQFYLSSLLTLFLYDVASSSRYLWCAMSWKLGEFTAWQDSAGEPHTPGPEGLTLSILLFCVIEPKTTYLMLPHYPTWAMSVHTFDTKRLHRVQHRHTFLHSRVTFKQQNAATPFYLSTRFQNLFIFILHISRF